MSTILPENATSWRDLADQLSPQQIERLEELERDPTLFGRTESEHRAALLHLARSQAQDNFADMMFAHVPSPAGIATNLRGWAAEGHRYFDGSSWVIDRADRDADITVRVDGTQHPDGSCVREITLFGETDLLSVEQARKLAEALIAAADEIDGLAVR